MAFVVKDRVRETTTTTGTGTISLGGAVSGYQAFSTIGDGNTTYYTIAGGTQWEVGIGTYASAGNTLARTTLIASSTGSAINFAAGTKDVFVGLPAAKAVETDTAQTLTNKTFGDNPTYNGGTANGVAYLNGSKVLTTGSALTFDGTTLNFGGTAQRITGDFSNATVANRVLVQTSTTNGNTTLGIVPNGSATTTGVIAGNSSDPDNWSFIGINALAASTRISSGIAGTGTYLPLTFYTGGSERMRIDTSGNLGLGVTPSAWNSTYTTALQLKGGFAALSSNFSLGYANLSCNAYEDGNDTWKYVNNYPATRYRQSISGVHSWFTAPSGTAGNAISFTQAMTLDAIGNLGIGTTSPGSGYRLDVNGGLFRVTRNSQSITLNSDYNSASTTCALQYHTGKSLAFLEADTERMRIDSSGNVVLKTGSLQEVKTAIAASDINLSTGNYFTKTISGTTTFTVSNVPATGTAISLILELTNGGSATINWWSGMKWAGGTAPTLTSAGKDILGFYTYDGGTTWNGLVLAKDVK